MGLTCEVKLSRGDFLLDVALRVKPGETVALMGANGSGKSTLVAALAGHLIPQQSIITVGTRTLTRTGEGSERRVVVPPPRRRVGLLGQEALLFPHLSAEENIAFGVRSRGESAGQARRKAGEWLDAVGLSGMASRKPSQLSGGQQQRVALARALAAEPEVLLLDEPMAALDVQNASLVRTLLRERLANAKLATILITHDVVDAMVLADRVALLDEGQLIDSGPVEVVLGQPINAFAADLVGVNMVEGLVGADGRVHTPEGRVFAGVPAPQHATLPQPGTPAAAVFAPSAVSVSVREGGREPESALPAHPGTWSGVVERLEPSLRGVRLTFHADAVAAELAPREALEAGVAEGSEVMATVAREDVTIYPLRKG